MHHWIVNRSIVYRELAQPVANLFLSGKIANLFGKSVEMKTEKECLYYQKVEAVYNFNLHGIFVLSEAISLSELSHNLMISIPISFFPFPRSASGKIILVVSPIKTFLK